MLVLSRTAGGKLHIGKDITITVTKIRGNKVFIGVEAPREVAVWRDDAKKLERGSDGDKE